MVSKNYEPMPVVECDKFILRSIEHRDIDDLYEFGSDPEVTRFLSWGPYEDRDEAKWAIDKYYLKRPLHDLPIGYAIIYKENNKMIGIIDYHTIDHYHMVGEIGFSLHYDYQNQGIMTEALKKMIMIGFDILNLNRIEIKHVPDNLASFRVIQKVDFRFEGVLRERYFDIKTEKYNNIMIYSILKEEYKKEKLSWQLAK